jgi:adenylosuccinate lyase
VESKDLLELRKIQLIFSGSPDAHFKLEEAIAKEFGFKNVLDSTGQIYPRSFDY